MFLLKSNVGVLRTIGAYKKIIKVHKTADSVAAARIYFVEQLLRLHKRVASISLILYLLHK